MRGEAAAFGSVDRALSTLAELSELPEVFAIAVPAMLAGKSFGGVFPREGLYRGRGEGEEDRLGRR